MRQLTSGLRGDLGTRLCSRPSAVVITQGEGVTTWHGACVHGESLLWDVPSPAPLRSPGPSPAWAFAWALLCSQVLPEPPEPRPHPARQPCSGSSFPLPRGSGASADPQDWPESWVLPFCLRSLGQAEGLPQASVSPPGKRRRSVQLWLAQQVKAAPGTTSRLPPRPPPAPAGPPPPRLDGEDRAPCGSERPWALVGTACNTSALALRLPCDRWVIKGGK